MIRISNIISSQLLLRACNSKKFLSNQKWIQQFSTQSSQSNDQNNNQQESQIDDKMVIIVENKEHQKQQNEYFKLIDYVKKERFIEKNFYNLLTVAASLGIGSIYENVYLLSLSLPGLYNINQSERFLLKMKNLIQQKLSNYEDLYKSFNIMLISKICNHSRTSKYFTQDTFCIKDPQLSSQKKDGKSIYIYEFSFFDLKSGAYGEVKSEIEYSSNDKFSSRYIEISFDSPERWKGVIEDPDHTINIL